MLRISIHSFAFLLLMICLFLLLPLHSFADVGYSVSPGYIIALQGSTFTTRLDISYWNSSVGAFSILIKYDPGVIQIQDISIPDDSILKENGFIDSSSFASGSTRIVHFQISELPLNSSTSPLANVHWKVVGAIASSSDIGIEVQDTIDFNWNRLDVQLWPSMVDIDNYNNFWCLY